MDIKKFFDQTVREVKREVNKKVLKVPEIEQKVYEATSNEPWGPHGTLMGDIASATRNFNEYQMIMSILWKRLNDTGKNWRHVYKSLTVLEFLVANGAERIIDELREHAYQVQTLVDFQYMEPNGKDQGINVRKKAQTLVGLLNDKDKIREVRNKAASNRDKYRGVSSNGSFTKQSSYSGSGGSYGYDRDEDDRYGGSYGGSSSRGGRDDDRYGDRDKEDRYRDDRYRDDDRSTRDSSSGDRYRDDRDRDRFEDDRYGSKGYKDEKERDRYEDDRYGSKGGNGYGNDKYSDDKYGSIDSNKERERDRDSRSFEDDERYNPRRQSGGGSRSEDFTPDDREPTPLAAAVARAHTSQEKLSATSSNASQLGERKTAPAVPAPPTLMSAGSVGGSYFASQPAPSADDFDDFDPRGTFRAADSAPANPAPVPSLPSVKGSTPGLEDLFGTSSFETSFVTNPAPVSNNPLQANGMNGMQGEDMFGSSTFNVPPPEMAAPAPTYFPPAPPPVNNAANGSFSAYPVSTNEPNTSFGSGSFMEASSTSIPPQSSFLAPPPPPAASTYSSSNSFQPQPGSIQAPNYPYASGFNPQGQGQGQGQFGQFSVGGSAYGQGSNGAPPQAQAPVPSYVPPPQHQKPPQPKSFQTKSTIWTDTISSGLVDLNISGPKTNPLAELGIDLKDSIFSAQEKRKEEKAQPTAGHMGRAMGSGTGLGLAGAGVIAPPPAPNMMGGGMGMGMAGMRQPSMGGMGMGSNAGFSMAPGMGANPGYGGVPGMGVNPGYGVSPGMGMAPGMNPGMGGGYGPGMGMPGGYGSGMGLGGYSGQQQYSGYR